MLLKTNKLILLNCLIIVAVFFIGIFSVHAQGADLGMNQAANIGLVDPGDKDIRVFIVEVVRYFITFLGIIAVAMVMYSGFLWMTSGGDPEKVNKAKSALINSVIGLIIIISAFAIVTFIINFMEGGGGGGGTSKKPIDYGYGLGAYGNCAISSTYPEPFQKDVPRNTAIIVTFVEEVNQDSIISGGKIIEDGRIKIYKKGDEANFLKNVSATNVGGENKTFVFMPSELLGSPSENTEYYVLLSNDITKTDGKPVFDNCLEKFAQWSFEVSTKVDLTPPQVKEAGVFPSPDNNKDTTVAILAEKASGEITVLGIPTERKTATFSSPVGAKSATLSNVNTFSAISGNLSLAILSDGTTAKLENSSSGASLGTASVSGKEVVFPSLFTLTLSNANEFSAGDSWTFTATAYTVGDTLQVGENIYFFGSGGIAPGASIIATAQNIKTKLDSSSDIVPTILGSVITITAKDAGVAGNNIFLNSSNISAIGVTRVMSGGKAAGENVNVIGRTDRPRNSVIQITFNEAINPIGITGKASDIKDNIFIEDIDGVPGNFLEGKYIISNQYKTIEFVSDNLCGVNGCGEKIYCLPANSHLRVVLKAASLASCPGEISCATKAPFTNCDSSICKNGDGNNYPMASVSLNGVADMAYNSLDGDRNNLAEGPNAQSGTSAYNENEVIGLCVGGINNNKICTDSNKSLVCGAGINCQTAGVNVSDIASLQTMRGDDFEWSFYIGNIIKISAPKIDAITPNHRAENVSLTDPMGIKFDELMMNSSLGTGQTSVINEQGVVIHKKINLRSLNNRVVGYWTAVENVDNPAAIDGEPDWSRVDILHPQFYELVTYRPQVGSGVKDIYQNCFKPSEGPLCIGETTDAASSCCPNGADISAVGEVGLDGKGNCK